jgi:hypothetical protein
MQRPVPDVFPRTRLHFPRGGMHTIHDDAAVRSAALADELYRCGQEWLVSVAVSWFRDESDPSD